MNKISTLFLVFLCVCGYVAAQPTISGVSPMKGHPGSTVTISGSNFNTTPANNIVYFGATRAIVTAAAATSLTATVPVGATYKEVSVNNTATALTGYGQYPFLPTFDNGLTMVNELRFDDRADFSGGSSLSLAIGDLDGDGKTDIVTANYVANTISVYRNTGAIGSIASGSFAAPVTFVAESQPHTIAIGDIDRDGKPDIVVSNYSGTVSVFRNISSVGSITSGSFAAKVSFATAYNAQGFSIGDIDGDGRADLAIASDGKVSVLRNTASTGTINSGSFAAPVTLTTGDYPRSVTLGDINGDGKKDIAVSLADANVISVFRNISIPGIIDAGSFATKVDFATGSGPGLFSIGDIDGDGKPEIVVENSISHNVSVLRNTSTTGNINTGSFAAHVTFAVGDDPYGFDLGDFNGDGKPDIAVTNRNSSTVSVLRNTASSGSINSSSFASREILPVSSQQRSLAIGDFDGDGKADIATANFATGGLSVIRNNPIFGFSGESTICIGATTTLSIDTSGGVWSSQNEAVATIGSTTGIVTGITGGTSIISYTIGGNLATMVLTVEPAVPYSGTITGATTVSAGGSITLANAITGGVWASSNTSVATISSAGVVTGVAAGTSIISYTVSNSCGSTVATMNVSVYVVLPCGLWSNVGSAGFSAGMAVNTSLAIDGSGTPYVGYRDGTVSNRATVMKYNGSTWETLGSAGFSAGTAQFTSLAIDGSGTPYLAYSDGGNGNRLTVMKYDGGAWVSVGGAGFSVSGVQYTSLAIDGSGSPYVAYRDGGSFSKATVMKYNGSAWVPVGSTGFSAGLADFTSLAIDGSGTPYVAYRDGGNGNKATVMKYSGTAWVAVGTAGFSAGVVQFTSIAIDASGKPYVVYRDQANGDKATVMKYNGSNWVSVGIAGFSSGVVLSPSLAIDASGMPYVVYKDFGNSSAATVKAYNGINWVTVGNAGFSPGTATFTSLAIDGSGTPVVAFQDGANSDKATVMKFVPAAPVTGTPAVCVGATTVLANANPGGTWSSSNTAVATVDSAGFVTGIGTGTVTISYILGGCNSLITVTVFPMAYAGAITGNTAICTGTPSLLSNASTGGIWSSGTPSVATIGITGIVTGVSAGTSLISYTVTNGCSSIAATTVVTVNLMPAAGMISGVATVASGFSTILTNTTATGGVWTSSNPSKATIDSSGTLTGVATGTTTISYSVTNSYCISVATFNATVIAPAACSTWNNVGIAGFSLNAAEHTSLAIDTSGTLFVAYKDHANMGRATVMKFNGSNWVTVGSPWFSAGLAGYTSLALDRAGMPYVAYKDHGNSLRATVMKYNGSSWVNVGSAGFSAGQIWNTSLKFDNSGTPYVAYSDGGNGSRATVMKYNGSTWVPVGGTAVSAGGASHISMAMDASGTPYVAYSDGGSGSRVTVMKYNGSAWVTVGSAGFSAGGVQYNSLELDNSGRPYVAYRDQANGNKATVMKYNGSTWVPVGIAAFSSGAVLHTSLAIDASGNPSLGYQDEANSNRATVMKFDGSSWVPLGVVGFTASHVSYTSLAMDRSGTPYLAYLDGANGNRATVRKLVPSVAPIIGTATVCAGATTTFSNPATGGIWSSSNAAIATVGSTGEVTGLGAGTASINYTTATGCSVSRIVTVNVMPSAISGSLSVCAGSTTALASLPAGGTWNSGSMIFASVHTGSGLVTGERAGTASITYTLPGGCRRKVIVTVTPVPATITGSLIICKGSATSLSSATTGGTWSSGNSGIASVTAGVVTGESIGTAVISYSRSECVRTAIVTVNAALPANTGTATVCAGQGTTLSNTSSGGTWSSGNTSIATVNASTGLVSGVSAGTVSITYRTGAGCYSTTVVTVIPALSSITGITSVCPGAATVLSHALAGGVWSSGNTARATVSADAGIVTGVSAGTVYVTYTLGSCFRTALITVSTPPGAIGGGTAPLCAGAATTLSCSPGGGTWSVSNSEVAGVSTTGVVSGIAAGTTSVTYTNAAGCWSARIITVNPLPAAISGDAELCAGSTEMLSCSPAGGTWSCGTIARATISAFTGILTGLSAGTATITYTVGGCRSTIVATVQAQPAVITGPLVVCMGNAVMLSSTTAGGTWSSSNGEVATINSSGKLTAIASGTAVISYTAGGCVRTATVLVTGEMPDISGDTLVCVGGSSSLSLSHYSGTWSSSNTAIAWVASSHGSYSGFSVGTAIITYTESPGCFTTIQITVNSAMPAITGPSAVCVGDSITLSAAPITGATWSSWAPHSSSSDVTSIDPASGVLTGISAGSVRIYYWLSRGCNSSRYTTVNATPGTIAGTASLCTGATSTLSCSPGGGAWSSDNTAVATISTTGLVTAISPGTATISYTNTSSCRSVRIVTVNEVPSAITGPSSFCAGSSGTFTCSPEGGIWSMPHSVAIVIPEIGLVTAFAAGSSPITYTLPSGCFSTGTVHVSYMPPMAITGATTVSVGGSSTLVNGYGSGVWSSSNTAIASIVSGSGVLTGVSVGTTTISFSVGSCARTTTATIIPAIADITGTPVVCVGQTNATLGHSVAGGTWSSSPTSIATVHAVTGLLTGVGVGTARVTYTLSPGISTSLVVTVNGALAAIAGTLNVCPGSTTTLSHSTGGGTWSSSNITTATIDASTGIVTGVTPGTTVITYSSGMGCYRTAIFTVAAGPGSITATGSAALCAGTTTTLSCSPGGGTWSSSNPAIATISATGLVTGVSSGTATITYTDGSSCRSSHVVTVNALPSAITGPSAMCALTSSSFSATPAGGTWSLPTYWAGVDAATGYVSVYAAGSAVLSYTLPSGCRSTHALTMLYTPTILSGLGITFVGSATTLSCGYSSGIWSSSNPAIASVGAGSGVVSGVSAGTATISYSAGTCARTRVVTVNAPIAASFGTPVVCVGQTNATMGNPVSGGTWSSSNTSIATVHAATGLLTGIGAGTANITYTLSPGMYTIMIATVSAALPANAGTTAMCTGATTTLTNAAGGGTWSSSNTLTATVVPGTGVVTGVTGGTATISYSVNVGCYRVSTVTINSAPNISGVTSVVNGGLRRLNGSPGGGTWSSANAAVATVSGFGYVAGHSIGFTTVTYTLSTTGCFRTYPMMVFAARPGDADATVPEAVKELKVYPNPSSGVLTIDAPVAGAFTVYTIDGRQVAQYSVAASANRISLPQQLAAGVYMCRFAGADGSTAIVRLVYEP